MPLDSGNCSAAPPMRAMKLDRARPVAFMHLPKAAGSAIALGLRETLQPKHETFGWDFSTLGRFRNIASLAPHLRRQIYPTPASLPEEADFITGHIAFSTLIARYPHAQIITFLREPTSRLLSHFLFMRSHREIGVLPWGDYAPQQRLARRPLGDFLASPAIASQTDNLLCRLLLWPDRLIPDDDFIDPAHDRAVLDRASARLDRFAFIDTVENPAMVSNLARWLGGTFRFPALNETQEIPPEYRADLHQQLTPKTLALLHRATRLDLVLWQEILRTRMAGTDPTRLRLETAMRTVTRHATLMMKK